MRYRVVAIPFAVLHLWLTGCSYPLDPNLGAREILTYARSVEKTLPSGWKMSSQYNPYGFGILLIRPADNRQYLVMPYGKRWPLELVVYLSAHERIGQRKISHDEYAHKETLRLELTKRQKEIYKELGLQPLLTFDALQYVPIPVNHEMLAIEYNHIVDQQRRNEENFPRYFTETFGVKFDHPKAYEMGEVEKAFGQQFQEMVDKIKAVFQRYELNPR